MRTRLRACLVGGLVTGMVGVAGFGVAHSLFISPLAAETWEGAAWTLYPGMFVAPMVVALPISIVAGLAMGWFWSVASRRHPPGSLAWIGAISAALLVPSLLVNVIAGPVPDDALAMILMATPLPIAAAAGARLAGWKGAVSLTLGGGFIPFALSPFFMSTPLDRFVSGFALAVLAVMLACGHVMTRLVRRWEPRSAAQVTPATAATLPVT